MKIETVNLLSQNIQQTKEFYTGVLGLESIGESVHEITFIIGYTQLNFRLTELTNPNYHLAIDIPRNRLEEASFWLQQQADLIPVNEGELFSRFDAWNASSFYFYDNNGNLLELICRYDLDNRSEEEFASSSLLYISEVGIVSRDVQATAKRLMAKYGLAYYAKQPPTENFVVLGNETGLIILVSDDRNWYPTTRKAEIFPLSIAIEMHGDPYQKFQIDVPADLI